MIIDYRKSKKKDKKSVDTGGFRRIMKDKGWDNGIKAMGLQLGVDGVGIRKKRKVKNRIKIKEFKMDMMNNV